MKERPILFSAPMVRAILEGRKTQTRRVVKPQPTCEWFPQVGLFHPVIIGRDGCEQLGAEIFGASDDEFGIACPYGAVGDRLWVRECIWAHPAHNTFYKCSVGRIYYDADLDEAKRRKLRPEGWKKKPSIHMPRWASRITLEITDVQVQRVKDMTGKDVVAEGFPFSSDLDQFKILWNKLNPKTPWEANPWVWAITFERVEQ